MVLAFGKGTQASKKARKETTLDLGTAMAISGAAVSSNMGALTIKPLTFTLALLNSISGLDTGCVTPARITMIPP